MNHKELKENTACILFTLKGDHYDVSLLWNMGEDYPDEFAEEIENILHGLAGILAKHRDDVVETGANIRMGFAMARRALQKQSDDQDAKDLPDTSSFNIDPKLRH